jgi:hypothetical protein
MNRLVIFEKNGQLVSQPERLTSNPSGNGAQRRKAIKSGWQPSWVKTGQPMPFYGDMRSENDRNFFGFCVEGSTEFGAEIYNENEHVAMMGRDLAAQTVANIVEQNANFEVSEFVPVPVFIGYQLLCWVCDQKYASTVHEGHPICGECIEHLHSLPEWNNLSDDITSETEAA